MYAAGTRRLIASGIVDTGGGYCSQNVMPVHVATGDANQVDIEVTTMSARGRRVTVKPNLPVGRSARRLVVSVSQ